VLTELFFAEAGSKYLLKAAFFKVQVSAQFSLRKRRPYQPLLHRPMNALQICRSRFSHKETLQQTLFERSALLDGKQPFCVFEPFLGGSGATYAVHLRLIGKQKDRAIDLLLLIIELFALGVTFEALRAKIH